MIHETDQWKLNGDCDRCRRATFCRKNCTTKKKADARLLQRTIAFPNLFAGKH